MIGANYTTYNDAVHNYVKINLKEKNSLHSVHLNKFFPTKTDTQYA